MAVSVNKTMARPVPILTGKLMKKTLGNKKKVIRNTLLNPHPEFWPTLSESESKSVVDELLRNMKLPQKNKKNAKNLWHHSIELGVNSVSRSVKNHALASVLITDDMNPKSMMQHVITLCAVQGVPVLVVKNLRIQSKNFLGFLNSIIGLKNCIANESHALHKLHTLVLEFAKLHEPPAHLLQFKKPAIDTVKIDVTSPKLVKCHKEDSSCNSTPFSVLYLNKTSSSKAFIPPSRAKSITERAPSEESEFISIPNRKSEELEFISIGKGYSEDEDNMDNCEPMGISQNIKLKIDKKKGNSTFPLSFDSELNEKMDNPGVNFVSCRGRMSDCHEELDLKSIDKEKSEDGKNDGSQPMGISQNTTTSKKKLKKDSKKGKSTFLLDTKLDNTEVNLDISCQGSTSDCNEDSGFISLSKEKSENEGKNDSSEAMGRSQNIKKLKKNPKKGRSVHKTTNNTEEKLEAEDHSEALGYISFGKDESEEEEEYDSTKAIGISQNIRNPRKKEERWRQNKFPSHIPFKYARVQPKPRVKNH